MEVEVQFIHVATVAGALMVGSLQGKCQPAATSTSPLVDPQIDHSQLFADPHLFPSAMSYAQAILAPASNNKVELAPAWNNWAQKVTEGISHYTSAEFDQSLEQLTSARSQAQVSPSLAAEGRVTDILLAQVMLAKGDIKGADKLAAEALADASTLPRMFEIVALAIRAHCLWQTGDLESALSNAHLAMHKADAIGEVSTLTPPLLKVDCAILEGQIAAELGEMRIAQGVVDHTYEKMRVRYSDAIHQLALANYETLIGTTYLEANAPESALERFQEASKLREQVNDSNCHSRTHLRLLTARAAIEADQIDIALELLPQISSDCEECTPPDNANLAKCFYLTGLICEKKGEDDAGHEVISSGLKLLVDSQLEIAEGDLMLLKLRDLRLAVLPYEQERRVLSAAVESLSTKSYYRCSEVAAGLAKLDASNGQIEASITLCDSLLDDFRLRVGVHHPSTIHFTLVYAKLLRDGGKQTEAITLLKEHLQATAASDEFMLPIDCRGRSSAVRILVLNMLAGIYQQSGGHAQARTCYTEIIELFDRPITGDQLRKVESLVKMYDTARAHVKKAD